jgi:hypothetical protein
MEVTPFLKTHQVAVRNLTECLLTDRAQQARMRCGMKAEGGLGNRELHSLETQESWGVHLHPKPVSYPPSPPLLTIGLQALKRDGCRNRHG